MVTWPWRVGPARQRGEEESSVPIRFAFLGCALDPLLGRNGFPEPFSIFFVLPSFLFLFSLFPS
jgi:hypothetical protein